MQFFAPPWRQLQQKVQIIQNMHKALVFLRYATGYNIVLMHL